jgi:hypothetical protein
MNGNPLFTRRKKRRSRFKRDTVNPPRMKITERDIQIVRSVSSLRFATAKQVALMIGSNLQTARIRLYLLWQNRLLDRVDLPLFVGEGSPPSIYVVGSHGRRLIAEQLGIEPGRISRVDTSRNYYFLLHHTLRRNDFRAAILAACRERNDLDFMFWKQDRDVGDTIFVRNGRCDQVRVPLVPDGLMCIQTPKGRMCAYVEIDRGTIGHRKFFRKQRGYYEWWKQKVFIERYGVRNFRVLTVTTNDRRMGNLIRTTIKASDSGKGSGFFWFTTFDRISLEKPSSIFDPIWYRAVSEYGEPLPLISK